MSQQHMKIFMKAREARAGIILFTLVKEKMHFLLGIDKRTRELTDFGGGNHIGETLAINALREFNEETCEMFGHIINLYTLLSNSVCIQNENETEAIYFVYIDPGFKQLSMNEELNRRKQHYTRPEYNELIGLKWISEDHFTSIVFDPRKHSCWRRLQRFLYKYTTWDCLRKYLIIGPIFQNNLRLLQERNLLLPLYPVVADQATEQIPET